MTWHIGKGYSHGVTEETPEEFVIDELSRRTGLTVRSLRSYQTQKLLPPPTVRGRTGYYGDQHLARIELIKDLQSQGLKLSSIARMVDRQPGTDADLLRFTRTVSTLFGESAGTFTTAEEMQRRFAVPDGDAAAVITRAIDLGLVQDDLGQLGFQTVKHLDPGHDA